MKMKLKLTAIATIALLVHLGDIRAQEPLAAPETNGVEEPVAVPLPEGSCDECRGQWLAGAEATFLRFHVADGFFDDDVFGFEVAPRFTVGYLSSSGLGARVRWWGYDHDARDSGFPVSVDTYNLDFEVFTGFDVNCRVVVEASGGLRINEMDYRYDGDDISDFDGVGGIFGVKAAYMTSKCSDLYARASWAFLMGNDSSVRYSEDVVRDQAEIGVGFEHSWHLSNCAILTGTIGAEWQHWDGYTLASRDALGFFGFLFGLGLAY